MNRDCLLFFFFNKSFLIFEKGFFVFESTSTILKVFFAFLSDALIVTPELPKNSFITKSVVFLLLSEFSEKTLLVWLNFTILDTTWLYSSKSMLVTSTFKLSKTGLSSYEL